MQRVLLNAKAARIAGVSIPKRIAQPHCCSDVPFEFPLAVSEDSPRAPDWLAAARLGCF